MDGYEGLDRVSVAEAAQRLGVKEQAIRKRISRGTLQHDKDEDGRVYVYIASDPQNEVQSIDAQANTHLEALVDTLQEQNRFLREELARKDAILLNMTEAMKAIVPPAQEEEAPSEPQGSPEMATEDRVEPTSSEPTEGPQESSWRPWWRRIFGA
jgi:predicted ArsR family transcriptional regulator